MTRSLAMVVLLCLAACHGTPAPSPKSTATAAASTGLDSSEAVARAYAKALNEGTLEDGLALFPNEAVLTSLLTCTGPNPVVAHVAEQRKQLTEQHGKLQKILKEQKLSFVYVGPGEVQSKKQGAVEDNCTLQDDYETHEEFLRFEPESKARLIVMKAGGRFYLVDAPK
ncbi:MAG: hypothetical protein IPJ34_06020 [Myxococcales bacterium]|nr:hypothetical protein [Myxococcales bacterium]